LENITQINLYQVDRNGKGDLSTQSGIGISAHWFTKGTQITLYADCV